MDIDLPAEILCLAKRTCPSEEYAITSAWTPHVDHQYSRFYDWNLYFDKMRYLVFDILPKHHREYSFEYLRFLYALLLLARNDIPQGGLQPRKVYQLQCEDNEEALLQLLRTYDGKLCVTEEQLAKKVQDLKCKENPHLSDREAKSLFCGQVTVPVNAGENVDTQALFLQTGSIGLAADCPEEEYPFYDRQYHAGAAAFHTLVRQPLRSLRGAIGDLRNLNRVNNPKAAFLNPLQVTDVQEHIAREEAAMAAMQLPDLGNEAQLRAPIEEADKAVRECLQTRMRRGATLTVGLCALLLLAVGFCLMPLLHTEAERGLRWGLIFTGGALGLLALVAIITLFVLRGRLTGTMKEYNARMDGSVRTVERSAADYSAYLSHLCNVMRGYSVLSSREAGRNSDPEQIRIYNKHRSDLVRCREELREIFSGFHIPAPDLTQEPYPYDFTRAVDYPYPIPYSREHGCTLSFLQTGNDIYVPVNFVRRVTAKLEELYD